MRGITLGVLKCNLINKGFNINVKKRLYEGIIVPTALYRAETCGRSSEDRNRVNVLEMECFRCTVGVTQMDRIRDEDASKSDGTDSEFVSRVDQRVL